MNEKTKYFFDIHEYQAKFVMRKFNINVQNSNIAVNS